MAEDNESKLTSTSLFIFSFFFDRGVSLDSLGSPGTLSPPAPPFLVLGM